MNLIDKNTNLYFKSQYKTAIANNYKKKNPIYFLILIFLKNQTQIINPSIFKNMSLKSFTFEFPLYALHKKHTIYIKNKLKKNNLCEALVLVILSCDTCL